MWPSYRPIKEEASLVDDAERHYLQTLEAYRQVFTSPAGKDVFKDLCRSCFMYTTTLVPNDPLQSAYNEGMRSVVLKIQRAVEGAQDPATLFAFLSDEGDLDHG
jgi:hypothetical protein